MVIFQRYCHMYCNGELENHVSQMGAVEIEIDYS